MKKPILEDEWAVKAIQYLTRKEYSSEEILEAIAKIGIKKGKIEENDNS